MSAIYTRLITAARSGLLTRTFNELIEKIELALLSGDAGAYLHHVESEADALGLVTRLKSEGIISEVVNLDGEFHVKVNLTQFFEEAKIHLSTPTKSGRIHLNFATDLKSQSLKEEAMMLLEQLNLNPETTGYRIEFELSQLPNGQLYSFGCHPCFQGFSGEHPEIADTLRLAGMKNVRVLDGSDICTFELP